MAPSAPALTVPSWFCAEMRLLRKRMDLMAKLSCTPSATFLRLDELVPLPPAPPGVHAARSKTLSTEVFDNEDVPSADNFLQINNVFLHTEQMPRNDDGEQHEHGGIETHAIDEDASGLVSFGDETQDAANVDVTRSKIQSAEVFDSDDVHGLKHMPRNEDVDNDQDAANNDVAGNDDGEQYEYYDANAHPIDAIVSDFSHHPFIAPGEECVLGGDENDFSQHTANEDVPSPDTYSHMPRNDDDEQYEYWLFPDTPYDFSPHKIIAPNDDGNVQDSAINDAAIDVDCEDVPLLDNFIQKRVHHSKRSKYEYGDADTHSKDAASSDFSPHQFAPAANNDAAKHVSFDDGMSLAVESDTLDVFEVDDNGSTCTPRGNVASPKTLDPLHVNVMIEIAKKMSVETTNACVTEVATQLLKCMKDKMSAFEEKIKELEEDVAMTRHIQHATFTRRFGVDY